MDNKDAAQTDDSRYRLLVESINDYAIYMLDTTGRVMNGPAISDLSPAEPPDETEAHPPGERGEARIKALESELGG